MDALIKFMNLTAGRWLRVILGLVLMGWGWLGLGGPVGILVGVVGIVALGMGAWGRCLLEPFGSKPPTTHSA